MPSMLNVGFSGLNAAQIALNVASNNIANVNTNGYSRQEATMGSRVGLESGNGVQVTSIRRIADNYLQTQLWRNSAASGFQRNYNSYINTTEQILGGDALDISTGLDNFFAALNAATESPESSAPREQIISSATALANRFNQLSHNLTGQETQLHDQISTSVSQINSLTGAVAKLNKQITELAAKDGNTSQLEDMRDQQIYALSALVNVNVNRMNDGTVSVSLAQGQPLVLSGSSSTLSFAGDKLSLQFGSQTFPIEQNLQGGLGGLLGYRDSVLRPVREELNSIATSFADAMNSQQAMGMDINNPRTAGRAIFTYDPLNAAETISVTAGIQPDDLAFSSATAADNGPGDNRNLLAMLGLKNDHYDAYTNLLGNIAIQSGQSSAELTANEQLESEVKTKINSISGVNLDEEGIAIMQYTKAYQANAKVISTAGELFDTVMSMF